MLLELIPNLKDNKFIILLNKFFYSVYYLLFIALLTALTCIFGFEMYTYYIYIFCGGLFPCLFSKDMTPIFAPLGMAYSSVSLKTNNAVAGHSLFGDRMYHLPIICSLIVLVVLPRLIYELVTKKDLRKYKPQLLVGYLIFGVTLVLGGLMSPYYSKENAIFGLVEFLALSGCYFILIYIIKWKEMNKDYPFYFLLAYGVALMIEVFVILIINHGEEVRAGWGINNNIASQICICIAGPMYLAIKKKQTILYVLLADFMVLAASITNSRTGGGMAIILIFATYIVAMIKSPTTKKRIVITATSLSFLAIFIAAFFIFMDFTKLIYGSSIFSEKIELLDLNGREMIWNIGYKGFLENPSFGVGWYYLKTYRDVNFTFNFVPPRYHNTYVQLIASTGKIGAIGYVIHRYQTLKMTFTKPTLEKTFLYIAIMGLILTSIFDCHFFNLGPGLDYCIILAFIEGINIKDNVKLKRLPVFEKPC